MATSSSEPLDQKQRSLGECTVKILFVDQAPRTEKSQPPMMAAIEKMLNGYASPGTKVEIGFPDGLRRLAGLQTIGNQSFLNGLHHMMETPSIVRKIFWAAENAL